jgi:hypothetical protein
MDAKRIWSVLRRPSYCGLALLLLLALLAGLVGEVVRATPLSPFLRPDGTLDLSAGFSGRIDALGYRLISGPNEPPRFARIGGELLAPDDHWDDRFNPPGLGGEVYALAWDGVQGYLYVGGEFTIAGSVLANNVARWDGTSWSALGSGMEGYYPEVYALAWDDAHGYLYAGGAFITAGGVVANNIARWDGTSWAALGSGTAGIVYALA